MTERDLTIQAKAKGFGEAARQVDELTQADAELKQQLGKAVRPEAGSSEGSSEGGVLAPLAVGAIKLTLAIRGIFTALGLLPAASAVVAGITAVVVALRDEVRERERVAVAMNRQAQAHENLNVARRSQKASIERIAASRRDGGLTADAARSAQSGAARARAQFTQLEEGDVNTVFGLLGDQDFTQEELVNLSILQFSGKLNLDPRLSNERRNQSARRDLNLNNFDTFRGRETVQGQGLGEVKFKTHLPNEQEAETRAQVGSTNGDISLLRQRLSKVPELENNPELVEEAIKLLTLFGSVGELEKAVVEFTGEGSVGGRPATTLFNRLAGITEIGLPDQPGFLNQAMESVGLTNRFQEFRTEDLRAIISGGRAVNREGQVTIINNNQNQTLLGDDARAKTNREFNGNKRREQIEGSFRR